MDSPLYWSGRSTCKAGLAGSSRPALPCPGTAAGGMTGFHEHSSRPRAAAIRAPAAIMAFAERMARPRDGCGAGGLPDDVRTPWISACRHPRLPRRARARTPKPPLVVAGAW